MLAVMIGAIIGTAIILTYLIGYAVGKQTRDALRERELNHMRVNVAKTNRELQKLRSDVASHGGTTPEIRDTL